jgi:hypothetical protein
MRSSARSKLEALKNERGRQLRRPSLSLTERLFGLNREADDYLGRTVENLKKMVAGQATELAFSPSTGI